MGTDCIVLEPITNSADNFATMTLKFICAVDCQIGAYIIRKGEEIIARKDSSGIYWIISNSWFKDFAWLPVEAIKHLAGIDHWMQP